MKAKFYLSGVIENKKALFKNKKTGQEILAGDFNTDTPDFDGNYDIDDSDGADEIVIEYIIGEKHSIQSGVHQG